MKKKFFAALIACMTIMTTTAFAMEKTNVKLFYFSRDTNLENPIYTENEEYFIPLRECAEQLGAKVEYQPNSSITLRFSDYDVITYDLKENKVVFGSIPQKGKVININGMSYVNANDFYSLLDKEMAIVEDEGNKTLIVRHKYGMPYENIVKSNENFNFSLSLLNAAEKNQNAALSPISMKLSLAMIANGTTGQTQKEILNLLGYDTLEQCNEFFSNEVLKWTVKERRFDEDFKEEPNQGKIVFSNGVWYNSDKGGQKTNVFSQNFQQNIANYLHATANIVNDTNAVNVINEWAKQTTGGFLPEIIQDSDFEIALINTAYFKCCWWSEFYPEYTKKQIFHNIDGTTSETDFMNMTSYENYCETEGWQMVVLPYNDRNYNMYLFLPEEGKEQALNNEIINKLLTYCDSMDVELFIPRFEIEQEYDMTETLKAMGISSMYQNSADFNAMFSDGQGRTVTQTIQKIKITVNESGTEAAAATRHALAGHSADLSKPPVFCADRPFYYMITKEIEETGKKEVLFVGRYATAKQS